MNLGLLSLILLLAAIVLGFTRKANVGIVCIGFAMILTLLFPGQVKAKDVIAGFSTSLFVQMAGVMYLFAIVNANGTLELMAKKCVSVVPAKLIPVVMFVIGMILSAAGPGSIPCLAIIPVIAIPLSVSAGVNPIMTAIIGDMGAMAGRMSPLTPEAAVVRKLMEEQGMDGNTVPIGSSLGSSFVGQLIQRQKVHLDHGIFGSPDLDQCGIISAWLQSKLVVPLLTSFTGGEKKQRRTRKMLMSFFEMDEQTADEFMGCFSRFSPKSIKNEYYTDLLTHLNKGIHVPHTKAHFIYARKMGKKYLKRYKKYFCDPEIREYEMQHEQWLLGGEKYAIPVLKAIDEFMETPV